MIHIPGATSVEACSEMVGKGRRRELCFCVGWNCDENDPSAMVSKWFNADYIIYIVGGRERRNSDSFPGEAWASFLIMGCLDGTLQKGFTTITTAQINAQNPKFPFLISHQLHFIWFSFSKN